MFCLMCSLQKCNQQLMLNCHTLSKISDAEKMSSVMWARVLSGSSD